MAELLSDRARMRRWLDVEISVVLALAAHGVVPRDDADVFRSESPQPDDALMAEWTESEREVRHDVSAFVEVLERRLPPGVGRWVHYGLTSSDVVDTAQGMLLRDALELIGAALTSLISIMSDLAVKHRSTTALGRTHGQRAQPTTLGYRILVHGERMGRDLDRVLRARAAAAVGKLSGPVGTHANVAPEVERDALASLGLAPSTASQIVGRDVYAEVTWACASTATTIEGFATDMRLLAFEEVGEVAEAQTDGQHGSSAMPGKSNPVRLERLCGLATLVRAQHQAVLSAAHSWLEQDMAHSSVERVALGSALQLLHFQLMEALEVTGSLKFDVEQMHKNALGSAHLRERALLALVVAGWPRGRAYEAVRDADRRGQLHAFAEEHSVPTDLWVGGQLKELADRVRVQSADLRERSRQLLRLTAVGPDAAGVRI